MREKETGLVICDICGVQSARVVKRPQVLGRGERMMLVDNVPVISCKNCGESYMTSDTMRKLDEIRVKQKEKSTERKIAVAEFAWLKNYSLKLWIKSISEIQRLIIAKQILKA